MKTTRELFIKNFKRFMEEKNITRDELSRALGIPYNTICNWALGISFPRESTLQKLADYFGCEPSDFISEKEEKPSYRMYPVLGEIANGYDSFAVQDVIDNEAIPEEWIKGDSPENYIVLAVKGESNYPELRPGSDRLLIHLTPSVESGSLAAVIYDTDYATVKRVIYKKGEDFLELHSLNPNFPPVRIEGSDLDRCRVIGEVVRLIRKY